VVIRNNILVGAGIKASGNLKRGVIENNLIISAPEYGIKIDALTDPFNSNQVWSVKNNSVTKSYLSGIWADFYILNNAKINADFISNKSIDNGQQGIGWGSYRVIGGNLINFYGNTFGDDQTPKTQTLGINFLSNNIVRSGFYTDVGIDFQPLVVVKTSVTNDLGYSPFNGVNWNYGTSAQTASTHTNVVGDTTWNTGFVSAPTSMLGWYTSAAGAPGTQAVGPPWSQVNYVSWDYDTRTVGIGAGASTAFNIPLNLERATNANVFMQVKNSDTGTSSAASVQFVGPNGQFSIGVYPANASSANRQDKGGIVAASNIGALFFEAVTAGQTIDLYSGGTTLGAQLSGQVWKMPGGAMFHRNAQSGTYQILTNDIYIASTATSTKTLPAANVMFSGGYCIIKSVGAGVTTTVARTGSDTIDGGTSSSIAGNVSTLYLSDGVSNWEIQ